MNHVGNMSHIYFQACFRSSLGTSHSSRFRPGSPGNEHSIPDPQEPPRMKCFAGLALEVSSWSKSNSALDFSKTPSSGTRCFLHQSTSTLAIKHWLETHGSRSLHTYLVLRLPDARSGCLRAPLHLLHHGAIGRSYSPTHVRKRQLQRLGLYPLYTHPLHILIQPIDRQPLN